MSEMVRPSPEQPEEHLPLEGLEIEDTKQRFVPEQHRAFGSVPGLLGRELDVPPFHRLDERAWKRTDPDVIRQGLYGVSGGNAVNGLALNAERYGAIVRNHDAFKASIRAKTQAANRQTNDVRAGEKELLSVLAALKHKGERHDLVIAGLTQEQATLSTLAEWQRVPGYWRTTEVELRTMASSAWHNSFYNVLQVLKDQHDLPNEDMITMSDALAYRLTRGPQDVRIEQWGKMLGVSLEYNRNVSLLFKHSARVITSERERLEEQLSQYHEQHGILPVTK